MKVISTIAVLFLIVESALYGAGAAIGFTLMLTLFSGMRARMENADVPLPLRGNASALIAAGILSLAFMGFTGMLQL